MFSFHNVLSVLSLGFLVAGQSAAALELTYGPNPRSLDNVEVFDTSTNSELPALWQGLKQSGVTVVELNPTHVMRDDFVYGPKRDSGALSRRAHPHLWMGAAELQAFGQLKQQFGFELALSTGLGLSAELCDLPPEAFGIAAAGRGYAQLALPLLEAGIAIERINVDGPLLRLVPYSEKQFSCQWRYDHSFQGFDLNGKGYWPDADTAGSGAAAGKANGFDFESSAKITVTYMKTLRDLIAAHPSQNNQPPQVNWVINLPNWRVGDLPRWTNPHPRTVDLMDGIAQMVRAMHAPDGDVAPLHIQDLIFDYPYDLAEALPELFASKLSSVFEATRGLNPRGAGPGLEFYVNTMNYRAACLSSQQRWPLFLAYESFDTPKDRSPKPMAQWCLDVQMAKTPDDREKSDDAESLTKTLFFAHALLARDGVFGRHFSADLHQAISGLNYTTWGINPASNAWQMKKLGETNLLPK